MIDLFLIGYYIHYAVGISCTKNIKTNNYLIALVLKINLNSTFRNDHWFKFKVTGYILNCLENKYFLNE